MQKFSLQTLFSSLVLFSLLTACNSDNKTTDQTLETTELSATDSTVQMTTSNPTDIHTFAVPKEAKVKHLDLKLNVDFESKMLSGVATYDIEVQNNVDKIYLDTRSLTIENVEVDGQKANFELENEVEHLGQKLSIPVTPQSEKITITYKTSSEAEALQWLSKEQTAGKKSPFLFTQSQAILARTWVPTQDSPGIRFTYTAEVTVPKDLMAVMSAENPQQKNDSGVYNFKMEQPIPAYLLALSVGDLRFQPIGERTGVYAEPSVISKAAYEFEEMDKMLVAAEKLYGKYAWGRYDLIVLPPSFPFGGMENPRLTFATPTILAGDRSLTSLVAHELAHSWSGNLVTNATWNDFWLNEGFTVYFENRIMEEVYGKDYAEMLALISYQDLKSEVDAMTTNNNAEDTKLKLDLKDRNPDDGVTSIAYDKGFYFLKLIENTVGREKFDTFLNQYFTEFAFKTTNTEDFLNYLETNLLSKVEGANEKINPKEWIYETGIPSNIPKIESERYDKAIAAAQAWKDGTPAAQLETTDWTFQQWLFFLRALPNDLTSQQMQELDKQFKFSDTGNNEVLGEWLIKVAHNQYEKSYPQMRTFLVNVGRRKFLSPIYTELIANDKTYPLAKEIFEEAKPNYHFVSSSSIEKMLASKK
ncbi:M1 family metallopeptidase [Bernardetia sp.]|uniref:M1 family metallopeptidase n=1 Tax=Bernardetia sp. TaxID=1937974 RepID=UPI0025BE42DD|nr:M1 family metallopeptidase [Bernardetia sp.]